ncbi:hypothetical protein R3P38DRAFT_2777267 [Favolaschia claudopus]|uniref:Uncharacterized protein n=1 Tax=Favolaschia claudopus TaxID=2862362 RepID=A0AAW0BK76_9AGAR
MLNTTKAESNDVGSQANSFQVVSSARRRLAKIPRPLSMPETTTKERFGCSRGDVRRRDDRNFRVARNYSGSFNAASDIRFFEDCSFKHAPVGFREWVVAGWSPSVSQYPSSRPLHGIEWALLIVYYVLRAKRAHGGGGALQMPKIAVGSHAVGAR